MNIDINWFNQVLSKNSIHIDEQIFSQFEQYYELLIEWNQKMNLTGITEKEQVFLKHFYDSLTLSFSVSSISEMKIADIGSGAGFPGLPLKIIFPTMQLTIIDSLSKRIHFLEHVVQKLGLSNVQLIHSRAEDAARMEQFRDAFDLATARAVARLNVLHELCIPFVKSGGLFVAMKGTDPMDEIKEAEFSAKQLNCQYVTTDHYELPYEASQRHVIMYRKTGRTPKQYPRKAGVPTKNPLIASH